MTVFGCRPSGCRDAGFTLLELLLAIAISAVTASVLYASLAIAFNARDAVTDELRLAGAGRTMLDAVRADLATAARPTGILAGPFMGEPAQDAHGRAADEMSFFTNNRMMPADELMGELFAVRIGLIDAPEGEQFPPSRWLVREVHTNLLAPIEEEPVVQVLARHVWSLEMRYHDGNDWQDAWDSTTRGDSLPTAVELTLRKLPEDVDVSASRFELEEQTMIVRRTFYLISGARDGAAQGFSR